MIFDARCAEVKVEMKIMTWALSFITVILFEDVLARWHLFNITDIGQPEGYRQMAGKYKKMIEYLKLLGQFSWV